MSRRDIHVKKSDEEYHEYLDRNIRVSDTLHVRADVESDATNQPVPQEEVTSPGSRLTTRREPWFSGHWHIIVPVIAAVVVGVLGWYGVTLFSLNRELGAATANFAAVEREQSALAESVRRLEDRLDQELGALTLRVDRIVDTRGPNPESGGGK